jgi:hypothetical protein
MIDFKQKPNGICMFSTPNDLFMKNSNNNDDDEKRISMNRVFT